MDEYFAVLKQYAVFSGRAGRKEYWRFSPMQIGIAFALAMWLVAALPNEPGDNFRWRDLLPLARFGRGGAAVLCDDAVCASDCCPHLRRYRAPPARLRLLRLVAAAGLYPLYWRSGAVCPALLQRHGGRQPL